MAEPKVEAEFHVWVDGRLVRTDVLEAGSVKDMKRQVYGIVFEDWNGEEVAGLKQWKRDNL